jgi:hypothetical protein
MYMLLTVAAASNTMIGPSPRPYPRPKTTVTAWLPIAAAAHPVAKPEVTISQVSDAA